MLVTSGVSNRSLKSERLRTNQTQRPAQLHSTTFIHLLPHLGPSRPHLPSSVSPRARGQAKAPGFFASAASASGCDLHPRTSGYDGLKVWASSSWWWQGVELCQCWLGGVIVGGCSFPSAGGIPPGHRGSHPGLQQPWLCCGRSSHLGETDRGLAVSPGRGHSRQPLLHCENFSDLLPASLVSPDLLEGLGTHLPASMNVGC